MAGLKRWAKKMEVFAYKLPDDYADKLIGVYDKETGDSPHDLMAFGYKPEWNPPVVRFDVPFSRIDLIPSTNLPLPLIHNELGTSIARIAGDALRLIPISVTDHKGSASADFSLMLPTTEVEIWDLERSTWRGLDMAGWPANKPMFMSDMVIKEDLELSVPIAFNAHWKSMVVFQSQVADLIRESGSWAEVFVPQHYRNR